MAEAARQRAPELTSNAKVKELVDAGKGREGLKLSMKTAYGTVFNFASIFRGQHWLLSETEAENLAEASNNWLDTLPESDSAKFIEFFNKHFPLVALLGVLVMTLAPRIRIEKQNFGAKKNEPIFKTTAGGTAGAVQTRNGAGLSNANDSQNVGNATGGNDFANSTTTNRVAKPNFE